MPPDEFLKNDAFLTRELLRIALESAEIAVWKADLRQGQIELSSAMKQMMGLKIEQQVDFDEFFSLLHPDDRHAARATVAAALDPDGSGHCDVEFRLGSGGKPKWFSATGRAFFTGEAAERHSHLLIGTLREITARKDSDAAVQAALDDQRELLHEVNHRIKNSLQLVSSLLRLQARRSPDIATRHQLEDAITRISTIAHIHERLYRDRDIQRLKFGAFVSELCSDLQGSAPQCSLQVQSPEFTIATDRAIPLALIISELVTNAFKYAYPAAGGPVVVNVEKTPRGEVIVSVGDEGVGLPEGFAVERAQSLGMVLVTGMVRQLSARLEVLSSAPGVTFVVTASAGTANEP